MYYSYYSVYILVVITHSSLCAVLSHLCRVIYIRIVLMTLCEDIQQPINDHESFEAMDLSWL